MARIASNESKLFSIEPTSFHWKKEAQKRSLYRSFHHNGFSFKYWAKTLRKRNGLIKVWNCSSFTEFVALIPSFCVMNKVKHPAVFVDNLQFISSFSVLFSKWFVITFVKVLHTNGFFGVFKSVYRAIMKSICKFLLNNTKR